MKRLIVLIFLLSLFCLFHAVSQEHLNILSGEGSEFSLIRNDYQQDYILSEVDTDRFSFTEGDFLITGEGTFLELLAPSGELRLMVGENSSLSFDSLNFEQGSLITMTRGHLHGLMKENQGDLWISSKDTVCRLSQGEFGFLLNNDITLEHSEIITRVYSLEGSLEVMQRKNDPFDKRVEYNAPVTIEVGEMVKTSSWERGFSLASVFFDSDYSGYWRGHPFSLVQQPQIKEEQVAQTEAPLITQVNEKTIQEPLIINKDVDVAPTIVSDQDLIDVVKTTLALGTLFSSAAAVSYLLGESNLGMGLAYLGGINVLTGIGTLSYAYLKEPAGP